MRDHGSTGTVRYMDETPLSRHAAPSTQATHATRSIRSIRSILLRSALLWMVSMVVASAATADMGANSTPPPISLPTRRSVTTRDADGGVQRFTFIPSTSRFARHGGGSSAGCSLTADRNRFVLSNGRTVSAGTVVTSAYHFVEGAAVPFDLPPGELPLDVLGLPSRGPLSTATRTFSVFCDRTFYGVNFRGFISVPLTDPLLDPRRRIDALRNDLRLIRPTIVTPPVVSRYGGLVARSPVWLAIRPEAWTTQRSPTVRYRGATLVLVAAPRRLDVAVRFEPDPTRPSAPASLRIGCVPDVPATVGTASVPAAPPLPEQSRPGVGGPCRWTPPGPGVVTLTARVTYSIVFWVDGYTEILEDYVWTSLPATFRVGELRAVNIKP